MRRAMRGDARNEERPTIRGEGRWETKNERVLKFTRLYMYNKTPPSNLPFLALSPLYGGIICGHIGHIDIARPQPSSSALRSLASPVNILFLPGATMVLKAWRASSMELLGKRAVTRCGRTGRRRRRRRQTTSAIGCAYDRWMIRALAWGSMRQKTKREENQRDARRTKETEDEGMEIR